MRARPGDPEDELVPEALGHPAPLRLHREVGWLAWAVAACVGDWFGLYRPGVPVVRRSSRRVDQWERWNSMRLRSRPAEAVNRPLASSRYRTCR